MISHLRIGAAGGVGNRNAAVRIAGSGKRQLNGGGGRGGGGGGDRTSALQGSLSSSLFAANRRQAELYATGDVPSHFGGRGHLEGSCVAKSEGLLETKKEKRKRRRREKKGGKGGKGGRKVDSDEDDDMLSDDDSSDEEEEEKKVWKAKSCLGGGEESSNPFSKSTVQLPQNQGGKGQGGGGPPQEQAPPGIETDIMSMTDPDLDWSKTSKYGKKSNNNFQGWIDLVGEKMHTHQVNAEDNLFSFL